MTQCEKILELLSDYEFHSTLELRDMFIMQSATRVFELKKDGYDIESKLMPHDKKDGAKVAWYRLKRSEPKQDKMF
jgi:hypothetical protein